MSYWIDEVQLLYLVKEKRVTPATHRMYVAALKFRDQ